METIMLIIFVLAVLLLVIDICGGFTGLKEEWALLEGVNPDKYEVYGVVDSGEYGWLIRFINEEDGTKLGIWVHNDDTIELLSIDDEEEIYDFHLHRKSKRVAEAILVSAVLRKAALPWLEKAFTEAEEKESESKK